MEVRFARLDDVPELVQMAKQFTARSKCFKGMTFCVEETAKLAVACVMEDDCDFIVIEKENNLLGFCSIRYTKWFFKELCAIEEIFYALNPKAAVILAKSMVNHSLDKNAKKIYTSNTAGFGASAYKKIMQRQGFKVMEEGVFLYYEQV